MPPDDVLIARWLVPDEAGPHEARVRGCGVSAWALIGYWQGVNHDARATAEAYQIHLEAMEAVLALYRRFRPYIDAQLLLNRAAAEDWPSLTD